MDTDVEVCGSIDRFLRERAFSGFENEQQIPTGIMASEKGHPFIKLLLDYYDNKHFVQANGSFDQTTNVEIITKIGLDNGLMLNDTKQSVFGMTFYPHDVFCPKNYFTGEIEWTSNTICIHHFAGSWKTEEEIEDWSISLRYNKILGNWLGRNIGEYMGAAKRGGVQGMIMITKKKLVKIIKEYLI